MFALARREFEKHYDCKMTVIGSKKEKVGNITEHIPNALLVEDQPCRISKKTLSTVSTDEGKGTADYAISLYCAPELDVPVGSRITVTDPNGNIRKYRRTSESFNSYRTHQEMLIIREVTA